MTFCIVEARKLGTASFDLEFVARKLYKIFCDSEKRNTVKKFILLLFTLTLEIRIAAQTFNVIHSFTNNPDVQSEFIS